MSEILGVDELIETGEQVGVKKQSHKLLQFWIDCIFCVFKIR